MASRRTRGVGRKPVKIVIDMNLSPLWADYLSRHGFEAAHWSRVGDQRASDPEILAWARENGFVVFSHDLDFSRLLALTRAVGPSVVQVRTEDVLPPSIGPLVLAALRQHRELLEKGALAVIDSATSRVRMLPLL
ncbi:MAG TPA: DUF5615 family PIN-like protein [Thermoanaerobaculia bacterium]|nr:DUF5615 family PIN-like protein [Thermoanaerobaculia bacterium]